MEHTPTAVEIRREKDRLKKRRNRQELRDRGEISDQSTKVHGIIQRICLGKKTRVTLKDYGITLDMIPCDHSTIHPDVLDELQGVLPVTVAVESAPPASSQPKPRKLTVVIRGLSLAEAHQIFDQAQNDGYITKATCNTYKKDLSEIIQLMGCSPANIVPCLKKYDEIFTSIKKIHPNISTYKKMLTPIISLGKYNEWFSKRVDLEKYHHEMNALHLEKADGEAIVSWSKYVEMRKQLSLSEPHSTKYLLLCLYTMLPPVHDNYGKVFISNEENNPLCTEQNCYYTQTGRLVIREYKIGEFYSLIDAIIPDRLRIIIAQSLELFPRKYLITMDNSPDHVYDEKKGGKLSSIFSGRFFKFTINDLRHSCETYVNQFHDKFTFAELKLIRMIMGHNAIMGDIYTQRQIEDSKDYSIKIKDTNKLIESIFHKLGGDE